MVELTQDLIGRMHFTKKLWQHVDRVKEDEVVQWRGVGDDNHRFTSRSA